VLIGGGAGGVELILAIRARLLEDARVDGRDAARFLFTLVTAEQLLASSGAKVQRKVRAALERKGVTLVENRRVLRVTADAVHCAGGKLIAADAILVTTHAAPPPWFAETGLALDAGGFLAVGPTLQSTNDADVFGAGDCVGLVKSPREKAGVYAVRAGPPLADNIRRRALGRSSKRWTPQRRHLSILTTGERNAIASWGPFAVEGAWVWRWKNSIDQRWMAAYRDIDAAS
jgi:NADH dehydrogenase FAD-containing subunit